jgi:hypothetical protein
VWAGSGRVLLVVVLAVALAGVPVAHAQAAVTTSTGALTTAGGRARIALVAALNNTPGWANPTGVEALSGQAGLSLAEDLRALNRAPRTLPTWTRSAARSATSSSTAGWVACPC